MAEIDALNRINPAVSPQQTMAVQPQKTGNVDNDTAQKSIKEIREEEEKHQELRERLQPELENVVAMSEDGDTVQVSDEGQEQLGEAENQREEEERVAEREPIAPQPRSLEDIKIDVSRAEEEKETKVETRDEERLNEIDDSPSATRPTSLEGYTNNQLEQMYLDGQISRYDYQSEVDKRAEEAAKEAEEEEAKEQERELNEDIGKVINVSQDSERKARAVDLAYANPSQIVDAETRLEAIERVEEAQNVQAERQVQQRAQQQNETVNFWIS